MTIVVGVAAPDGIVLASDSRTTYQDGERSRIASDYAQKMFSVSGRWAVATYGDAFVGSNTIDGLIDEFIPHMSREAKDDLTRFATELGDFFDHRFAESLKETGDSWDVDQSGWPLGFVVAGYDSDGVGRIRDVLVPGPEHFDDEALTTTGGVLWRGQTDVVRRLLYGVDWTEFESMNIQVPDELGDALLSLQYIALPPITLQDAVDYASFLVRTTIDMQRFSDGTVHAPGLVPACGGAIQVIAVKRSGVSWVNRPTVTGPTKPGWAEGAESA